MAAGIFRKIWNGIKSGAKKAWNVIKKGAKFVNEKILPNVKVITDASSAIDPKFGAGVQITLGKAGKVMDKLNPILK